MKQVFKQTMMMAVLALFAGSAIAQTAVSGSGAEVKNVNSSAGAIGNTAPINSGNTAYGPDLSRAVGTAVAPALTTTLTETCMGSTSVGAGWSGASISFGTTWRDSACVRRLDARQVHQLGDAEAAKEVMCDSDLVRAAFQRVGRPCAEDGGTYVALTAPVQPNPVAEQAFVPSTADPITDEADLADWSTEEQAIHQRAMEAREAMRQKGY